jgi:hypothetical protein
LLFKHRAKRGKPGKFVEDGGMASWKWRETPLDMGKFPNPRVSPNEKPALAGFIGFSQPKD